jgi:hypothetical protein
MKHYIALTIIALALLTPLLTIAQNDPGHDSLYVLRSGDNITGNFNITGNVTAEVVQITSKFFGDYLDIRANGTVKTSPTLPAIQATSSNLYLDSASNLYLNRYGGTSGIVQVGDTSTDGITLRVAGVGNVTQNMYVGQNLTISGSATVGGSSVCTPSNGLCGSSDSNISGSGSSGQVAYFTGNTALSSTSTFTWDSTNDRLGIDTASPSQPLDVNGTARIRDLTSCGTIETNSNGVLSCGSGGAVGLWTNSSGDATYTDGNVGIGTTTPTQQLAVDGNANISQNVTVGGGGINDGNGNTRIEMQQDKVIINLG